MFVFQGASPYDLRKQMRIYGKKGCINEMALN